MRTLHYDVTKCQRKVLCFKDIAGGRRTVYQLARPFVGALQMLHSRIDNN